MFYRRKIILGMLEVFGNELEKIRLQKLLFLLSKNQKIREVYGADTLSKIQELRKQSKELKIKDKKLKEVASVETIISDTITQEIPVDRNFTVELKPNQLTTIKIARIDSMITHVLDIKNRQDLFIYEEKVWRKKGFFRRLFTLNFKKDIIPHYQIVNSNPLIQVTDTRVIKISK